VQKHGGSHISACTKNFQFVLNFSRNHAKKCVFLRFLRVFWEKFFAIFQSELRVRKVRFSCIFALFCVFLRFLGQIWVKKHGGSHISGFSD